MAIKLNKNHSNLETIRRWMNSEKTDIRISNHISEKEKFRQDGEEFELQGIKYKKENGKIIKLTKSQGDIIREAMGDDRCKFCNCSYKWMNKQDMSLYRRTGLCGDCLIEYETKLRIVGAYDSYEKYKLSSYALGDLKDKKESVKSLIKFFIEHPKDAGDVTLPCENGIGNDAVWVNTNRDKIFDDAKSDLKKIKKLITHASKIKQINKKLYVEKCKEFKLEVI